MDDFKRSLRSLLKIIAFVLLSAYIFLITGMLLSGGESDFAKANEYLRILPIIALTAVCIILLRIEIGAFERWMKGAMEKADNTEVLSAKQTIVLITLLAVMVILFLILIRLYGVSMSASQIAFFLFAPTIETVYAVLLWLGVAVLIKQVTAKSSLR